MPHGLQVEFETAWCPPEEVCNAIRDQFDDLSISWFYDEPGCEIAGYLQMPFDHTSPYTEYNDLMKQAKKFEVVEDDDYKVTIDYENLTTTFELK